MKVVFLKVIVLAVAITGLGQTRFESMIGSVQFRNEDAPCLTIENASLRSGQIVYVVTFNDTQSVQRATIDQKLNIGCNLSDHEETFSFYSLNIQDNDAFGIGVINSPIIDVTSGIANVDLNGDGKKEYFRECASNEGIHLTVWTGKPLVGKRIWHYYWYAGYDTEPSCKKKDYQ